jgi:DNA (cytosine-5)-methyltransferase 1
MENVRGMSNKIDEIKQNFKEYLGDEYQFEAAVLEAQDYGVPQNRKRLIMIGNRMGINPSLIFEEIYKLKRDAFVLKDALEGLPELASKEEKGRTDIENSVSGFTVRDFEYPKTEFYKFINGKRHIGKLYNHKNRYNNPRDIEIFRRLPQGGNSLHPCIADIMPYTRRNGIFKDKYYKLEENKICKTITSHMKYDCNMYIHPWQARGLSPREAARIQTFPDDYVLTGPQNPWYAQVGNAVPVKLAKAIGEAIMKFL